MNFQGFCDHVSFFDGFGNLWENCKELGPFKLGVSGSVLVGKLNPYVIGHPKKVTWWDCLEVMGFYLGILVNGFLFIQTGNIFANEDYEQLDKL